MNSAVILEGFTPQRVWGLDVVNDFFMAGGCFGAFLCAAMWLVFARESFHKISLFALIVSLVCILAVPFNLIDDLKQPSRVLNFFFYGWENLPTSPMKWGVILLMITPLCLLGLIYAHIKGIRARKLAIFTLAISLCVPGYTGYILGASIGVAFWNTPVLPLLFIANGAVGGIGALALVAAIYARLVRTQLCLQPLCKLAGFCIIADLALRFFWLTFMLSFNHEITELYQYVFSARMYEIFALEFSLIAIIALNIFSPLKRHKWANLLAFVCMCAYSYAFKFNIVFAGQSMPKIMGGFLDFSPALSGQDSVASVLANWLICVAIFCLCAAFLPLKKSLEGCLNKGSSDE